jgi:hypothetical protein
MRIVFLSFSFGGGFGGSQVLLTESVIELGFADTVYELNSNDLLFSPHFFDYRKRHLELFLSSPSGGYGWKPYIIDWALSVLDEGDLIVYLDAGCLIDHACFESFSSRLFEKGDFFHSYSPQNIKFVDFCPPFILTHIPGPIRENLKESPNVQSGLLALRNTKITRSLVKEWTKLADNHAWLLGVHPNGERFSNHRYDQTLLNFLLYKDFPSLLIPLEDERIKLFDAIFLPSQRRYPRKDDILEIWNLLKNKGLSRLPDRVEVGASVNSLRAIDPLRVLELFKTASKGGGAAKPYFQAIVDKKLFISFYFNQGVYITHLLLEMGFRGWKGRPTKSRAQIDVTFEDSSMVPNRVSMSFEGPLGGTFVGYPIAFSPLLDFRVNRISLSFRFDYKGPIEPRIFFV